MNKPKADYTIVPDQNLDKLREETDLNVKEIIDRHFSFCEKYFGRNVKIVIKKPNDSV